MLRVDGQYQISLKRSAPPCSICCRVPTRVSCSEQRVCRVKCPVLTSWSTLFCRSGCCWRALFWRHHPAAWRTVCMRQDWTPCASRVLQVGMPLKPAQLDWCSISIGKA